MIDNKLTRKRVPEQKNFAILARKEKYCIYGKIYGFSDKIQ